MKNSALKTMLVSAYEHLYEKNRVLDLRVNYRLHIMSPDQTLRYIEKSRCSIARFGDGEFDYMIGTRDVGFQKQSPELTKALIGVLENKNEKLLLCVPRCLNTLSGCNEHAESFWIEWGRENDHHKRVVELLRRYSGKKYLFGDALITRPYIDWKTDKKAKRIFPKLRHLWENRDILIAEGEQTRLGVGNDLFDNARSVSRVLCPATGAFEHISEIKQAILSCHDARLILMALGPTATVLAAEFADMGIQALDLGHIDIEYEWFLRGAKERIPIPGKFTNEAKNEEGRVFSEATDEKYLSQIVARAGC